MVVAQWTDADYRSISRAPFWMANNKGKIPNIRNSGQNRELPPGTPLCGLRLDFASQRICTAAAKPNGRCDKHGGKRPLRRSDDELRDPDTASLYGDEPVDQLNRHLAPGRFFATMPKRLQHQYVASLTDPDLIVLRDHVAVLEARLAELLGRSEGYDSGELWGRLQSSVKKLETALADRHLVRQDEAVKELREIAKEGVGDSHLWHEIYAIGQNIRRMADSEQKRLIAAQTMVRSDQLMAFMRSMATLVEQNVADDAALERIRRGIQQFAGGELAALTFGDGREAAADQSGRGYVRQLADPQGRED